MSLGIQQKSHRVGATHSQSAPQYLYLDRGKKNRDINHIRKVKWELTVLVARSFCGKEEWVLVQLGSQCKPVEQPVWPLFPDYLSISCDYDLSYGLKYKQDIFQHAKHLEQLSYYFS